MKYLFYLLIVCAFAANAQEFLLFEMVQPKSFLLKFIPDVPYIVWSVISTICIVTFISMASTQIRNIKDDFKWIWYTLIGLIVIEGLFDVLETALPEDPGIGIAGFVVGIVSIILMAYLGYNLSKTYKGKIKTLGYVFTYIPIIFLVAGIVILSLLPEGYGEIMMKRFENSFFIKEEYFYSNSTIMWTWVLVILNSLTDIIVAGACLSIIDSDLDEELQEEENIQPVLDEVITDNENANINYDSPEREVKQNSGEGNHKKLWIIVAIVLILIGATTMIIQLVINNKTIKNGSKQISNDIYAELVLPWDKSITLKSDHSIPELPEDANWEIKDEAIVIYSGEGTTYWTIIDGYLYEGFYEDGYYWVQEWDTETESFVEEGFPPMPSMGEKLKSFKIYGDNLSPDNKVNQGNRDDALISRELKLTPYNGSTNSLSPQGGNTYEATNLTDNDLSTGWAVNLDDEGYDKWEVFGPTIGLESGKTIDYITINNGYGKNKESFNNNTRAAWIQIYRIIPPDTGHPEPEDILYEGPLKDSNESQRLEINRSFDSFEPIEAIKLKFSDKKRNGYYYGDKFKDLVISEIKVYGH